MRKEIKGFICGVVATSLVSCVSISAAGVWDKIDVLRNDIHIVVNGVPVNADNFLYNDTTYLPMRVVAEALGKDVQYDETTNTATIKDKGENNLSNVKTTNERIYGDINPANKHIPPQSMIDDHYCISMGDNGMLCVEAAGIMKIINPDGYKNNPDGFILECDNDNLIITKSGKEVYRRNMYDCPTGLYYDTLIDEILPALGIDNTPYL